MKKTTGFLVFLSAGTIAGMALAMAAPATRGAPPRNVTPADSQTCLLDDKAIALDIIAACTRLIESASARDNAFGISDAYNERGRAKAGLKRMAEALEDFNTALKLDPDNGDAHFNRGTVYFEQKKYDLALKDFDAAVADNPDDPALVFNRGLTKYRLGNKTGAAKDFDAAETLDPRYGFARERIEKP